MSRAIYDYALLKLEYVQGDMSIRQLSKDHSIATFSTVADRARREDWDTLRAQFRGIAEAKTVEALAQRRAQKFAQIYGDTLEALHAAILRFGVDLEGRWVTDPESNARRYIEGTRVTPADLAKLIDRFQLLSGGPTIREEHLGLNLTGDISDLPPELLRGLSAIARAKGAGTRSMGQSPLPLAAGARQVNGGVGPD